MYLNSENVSRALLWSNVGRKKLNRTFLSCINVLAIILIARLLLSLGSQPRGRVAFLMTFLLLGKIQL